MKVSSKTVYNNVFLYILAKMLFLPKSDGTTQKLLYGINLYIVISILVYKRCWTLNVWYTTKTSFCIKKKI